MPLGLLPDREYEEVPFQAVKGDTIVFFSDGVTDHLNSHGEEYGRTRLARLILANCHRDAKDLISAIFDDLDRFSKRAFDDQTLIVMKVQ